MNKFTQVGFGVVTVLFLVYFYVTRNDNPAKAEAEPAVATASPIAAPAPPPEPTPFERISKQRSVNDAIRIARPFFSDTVNDVASGAGLLAIWGANYMLWTDLNSIPETKRAMVMKDPEAERGKRLCVRGSIVEIAVDRSAGVPIYEGGLMTPAMQMVRFAAVRSTGALVENSAARFCGIVVGAQSYGNSAGGMTHAVYAVGMFDLPENRALGVGLVAQ